MEALWATILFSGFALEVIIRLNDKPGQPGCLILDVNMPEMTGLELQEHLNQQGNTVPITFLTSYGDIDMAVNALHSGAADFLQKPVKSEKLLASVEKAATASVTLAEPLRVMSQEEALSVKITFATLSVLHGVVKHAIFAGVYR